jgi:hypothetical protein
VNLRLLIIGSQVRALVRPPSLSRTWPHSRRTEHSRFAALFLLRAFALPPWRAERPRQVPLLTHHGCGTACGSGNLPGVGNFPRARPYLRISANRKYPILSKPSHVDRLSDQIRELREEASRLPDGSERDELLFRARQDEISLRLIQWVTFSRHLPPPEDLIPVRRHRLRHT